jgi:mannitol-1-phosphate 5-dehydrogenase
MKLVQIGAGNIGRSFIGQLFSHAGWEVVFVDAVPEVVRLLNDAGRYRIEIRDVVRQDIVIEHIRALDAADRNAVAQEIASADLLATAVGAANLPAVFPLIAAGLQLRSTPLDILICENVLHGAALFRDGLAALLPPDFPLGDRAGLVETSIGKMVPITPAEARRRNPLLLYAEAYNTLIVDRRAFRGPVPEVPGIDAKDNIAAYVDRKLFIHNLGHAAVAYIGHVVHPEAEYTWQALEDSDVCEAARRAMWESARALMRRYPTEFSERNQGDHIEDLLRRFANTALGDTLHRVGRDLKRKLGPDDRIIAALRLHQGDGTPAPYTTLTLACGLLFDAPDQSGSLLPSDMAVLEQVKRDGPEAVLSSVCGLDPAEPFAAGVIESAAGAYRVLAGKPSADWLARFAQEQFGAFSDAP